MDTYEKNIVFFIYLFSIITLFSLYAYRLYIQGIHEIIDLSHDDIYFRPDPTLFIKKRAVIFEK